MSARSGLLSARSKADLRTAQFAAASSKCVARGHQGPDQQSTVDLDAHHDLGRILGMGSDHLVQSAQALHTIGHPALGDHYSLGVHDAGIVRSLCPVDPNEDQRVLLPLVLSFEPWRSARRHDGSVL